MADINKDVKGTVGEEQDKNVRQLQAAIPVRSIEPADNMGIEKHSKSRLDGQKSILSQMEIQHKEGALLIMKAIGQRSTGEILVNRVNKNPKQFPSVMVKSKESQAVNPEGGGQKGAGHLSAAKKETPCSAVMEMVVPFVLSGFGNMGGGMILQYVQNWPAFVNIPELLIISPPLLGLKGDLEMTLCSRMSTYANLGHLKDKQCRRELIVGNMALVQCQCTLVGFLAPFVAIFIEMLFHFVKEGRFMTHNNTTVITEDAEFNFTQKFVTVLCTSILTANLGSIILSSLMSFVICFAKLALNINPDNIATPIAASSGDVLVMAILGGISHFVYKSVRANSVISVGTPVVLTVICCLLAPIWGIMARRNRYTGPYLFRSLIPITIAMVIQNVGGKIMEATATSYQTYAVFQVIINGFGGDLVSVHSSRMSTNLHRTSKQKQLPETDPSPCVTPWYALLSNNFHARFALMLTIIAAPSQIPFLFIVFLFIKETTVSLLFVLIYSMAATTQVALVLYIAYCLVHIEWLLGINPDNGAIPIMAALADFFGAFFLTVAYFILNKLKDPNAVIDES